MITLANTLKAADIVMDLSSESMQTATADLLNILRHDKRITNWAKFVDAMGATDICVNGALDTNFCIPHARTNAVQNIVIAAGRSVNGIPMGAKDSDERCQFVFIIGIPAAMDAEYLRLIGTVARIFRNDESVREINEVTTAAEFHAALVAAEKDL